MTRFARAKGSKASNERVPENATSWSEMKQQLLMKNKEIEENKKRQEIHNQRNANYKAFLEEREENERKKTTWADFPGNSKPETKAKSLTKATYKNNGHLNDRDSSDDEEFAELKSKVNQVLNSMTKSDSEGNISSQHETIKKKVISEKKSKQKKVKNTEGDQSFKSKGKVNGKPNTSTRDILNNNKIESDSDAPPEEETAKKEVTKPVIKVKKPKLKKLKIVVDQESEVKKDNKEGTNRLNKRKLSEDGVTVKKKLKKDDTDGGNSKKENEDKGKGNQKKKIIKENLTEKDLKKIEKKKQKRLKQVLKKKQIKAELKKQKEEMKEKEESMSNGIKKDQITNENKKMLFNNSDENKEEIVPKKKFGKHDKIDGVPKKKFEMRDNKKTKKEKFNNKEEHSRKKPFLPHKMFINGKELEIEYVDGFPVKKEDAQRLKKLRKEMISKGLPRSEINTALKLERRKAEKAFAREKKKVR